MTNSRRISRDPV